MILLPHTENMTNEGSTNEGTCICPDAAVEAAAIAALERSTSFWTYMIYFVGTCFIAKFLISEYALLKKKFEDERVQFSWSELLWYRVDYYFSNSQWAKPVVLLGTTFIVILAGAALLAVASGSTVAASTWAAWTYVADPGTHADAEGTLVRFVSLVITIGGMLIFALMIGIISEAIGEKVDDLRKGKSRVIESDHTLILGWTDKGLAIIQEIALANESEGGGTVVVLAEGDKEAMERMLHSAVESSDHPLNLLGTEVVFRSGNPLMEHDLHNVSTLTARSIVVLSPDGVDPDEADSKMVRQVLSLKSMQVQTHVVVEMQDIDNKDLVDLVADEFAEVVVAHDMIGRLMIQCAREPGLAHVLESLIGFEGSEFYIESWPTLVGKTFLEITCRFDDAVPVGVKMTDGDIVINPGNRYVIQKGDKVMVLAEDNDTYCVNNGSYSLKCGKAPVGLVPKQQKEKLLFCGWRRDMADMIMQLDEYVVRGSELWLFNTVPPRERSELLKDKGNKDELKLKNLTIKNVLGNSIVRRDLRRLDALDIDGQKTGDSITLDEFDSLLILADAVATENGADMPSLDSRSLASLLIIQDIQRQIFNKKQWELQDAIADAEEKEGAMNLSAAETATPLPSNCVQLIGAPPLAADASKVGNADVGADKEPDRKGGELEATDSKKNGNEAEESKVGVVATITPDDSSERDDAEGKLSVGDGIEVSVGGEIEREESRDGIERGEAVGGAIEKSELNATKGDKERNKSEKAKVAVTATLPDGIMGRVDARPKVSFGVGNERESRGQTGVVREIKKPCDPISEILDTRTRSLLQVANCKGYIMSNQIVSSAIAQVSEDRDMNKVLGELLSAYGCETCIRDISFYLDVKTESRKSFWDVALRARQRKEAAIGYKPQGMSYSEASKLILNPPSKGELRTWEVGDVVIVLSTHKRNVRMSSIGLDAPFDML